HRDLLRSMVLSRSGLSRLLGKLEDRGLITQAPDPEDQRGVLVGLTAAGEELREAAARTNVEIILAGFSGMTDADAEAGFELVSAIRPIPPAQGLRARMHPCTAMQTYGIVVLGTKGTR